VLNIVHEPCKSFHEPFNSCNLHGMPRSCLICSDNVKFQLAADMVQAGASDQAIADRLGSLSRMSVRRHRENHIAAPLQHRLAIAAKGSEHVRERQALAQAAAADAPSPQQFADAVLGLRAQAEKLERIESRLERMAVAAETGGSANAVSQLSAQQIRSVEVGARLAGVGGYAARPAPDAAMTVPVSITFNLGDGRVETMTVAPRMPAPNSVDIDI
jgi:hypothetical protein